MRARTVTLFSFLLLFQFSAFQSIASESEEEESATGFILHHVQDSHDWHFATIGHTHITLPLPVIVYGEERGFDVFMSTEFYNESHEMVATGPNGYKLDDHGHVVAVKNGKVDESISVYDFSITKNVASMLISIVVLLVVFFTVSSRYKKNPKAVPRGIQSLMEPIILFVRDEIAKPNIGHRYDRFMPYLLTLFFFILFNNLLGLTPGAANLTGNIAVTFTLAVITFIITNLNGNKAYWKHIFATPGVPAGVLPILVPVEFIGLFTKPFALMVRLFVSITAGHIVILSLIALGFIFQSYVIGAVSQIIITFVNLIELLVALIQAYVFTLFSSMYIGQAVADDHH